MDFFDFSPPYIELVIRLEISVAEYEPGGSVLWRFWNGPHQVGPSMLRHFCAVVGGV